MGTLSRERGGTEMIRLRSSWRYLMILALLFLFSGCADYVSQDFGTLEVRFTQATQRALYVPTISLDIASYRLTLTSSNETKTYHTEAKDNVVLEGLLPGLWTIEIAAYNGWDENTAQVSGQQVATLARQNDENRSIQCSVSRGQVTAVSLILVPLDEGSGSLTLTTTWPQRSQGSSIILDDPRIEIDVTGYNEHTSFYLDNSSYAQSFVMTGGETNSYTTTISDLIPGWYEIQTRLIPQSTEGDANLFYRSIDFARVVPGDTEGTIGVLQITDEMLITGAIEWVFSEEMGEALDNLTLERISGDDVTYGGITQKFACTYDSPTASYAWYIDGSLITDANSRTFSHVFPDEGTYRVLVVVQDGSVINGTELTLDVLPAYAIGDLGQAGGVIFYCDTNDDYAGWTYLEAAQQDITPNMPWSNILEESVGGTSDAIGTGAMNTVRIMAQEGHTSSAASACTAFSYGGYQDWFLPSSEELGELIANNDEIFESGYKYWSSTETSYRTARVCSSSGCSLTYTKYGYSNIYLRPIRSF